MNNLALKFVIHTYYETQSYSFNICCSCGYVEPIVRAEEGLWTTDWGFCMSDNSILILYRTSVQFSTANA